MKTIAKALVGDDSDSSARFLEVIVRDIHVVNIYVPNGNPVGSDKFAYKLAWMDRLTQQMIRWKQDDVPTLIGGDFNVIPEDIAKNHYLLGRSSGTRPECETRVPAR
jgi:exodeoxyribonuclease III